MCTCMLVAQSCPTLSSPTDCSPPGFSVHGILQVRILEWITLPSSRGSSRPRDRNQVSCIASGLFTIWTTREALCSNKKFKKSYKWNATCESYPSSRFACFLLKILLFYLSHANWFIHLYWGVIDNGRTSLVAQLVKNLPTIQETLVQFLGWKVPLEKW